MRLGERTRQSGEVIGHFSGLVAKEMFAKLNAICTARGRTCACHSDCASDATIPITIVSMRLSSTIPVRRKINSSDIVPVKPGKRTFRHETTEATAK